MWGGFRAEGGASPLAQRWKTHSALEGIQEVCHAWSTGSRGKWTWVIFSSSFTILLKYLKPKFIYYVLDFDMESGRFLRIIK